MTGLLTAWMPTRSAYCLRLVEAASRFVPVTVLVGRDESQQVYQRMIDGGYSQAQLDRIDFIEVLYNSMWLRNYGPMVVSTIDGGARIIDTRYIAPRYADDSIPTILADHWQVPVSRPRLAIGGSDVLANGAGSCITGDRVIEDNLYDLGVDVDGIIDGLRDYLGCQRTIFMPLVRNTGSGSLRVAEMIHVTSATHAIVTRIPHQPDAERQIRQRLASLGMDTTFIDPPRPHDAGASLFRSYTGAVVLNGGVLVPVVSDDTTNEAAALAAYRAAYPDAEIVPVDTADVADLGGTVRNTTMTLTR